MILKLLLGLWMALVIAAAFIFPVPETGMGELARIIYFHVPLAWVGVLAYLVSMLNGIYYLKTRELLYDLKAASNAELGVVFTLLATVTGAIFARHTWGMYWNWDPRQTTILVVLLIYGAYFALRSAVGDEHTRARLASVYSIFAFISVPFLIFIIPRLYATLHPDPIINIEGQLKMERGMFWIFIASLAGFTGLYAWLYKLQGRYLKVHTELKKGKS